MDVKAPDESQYRFGPFLLNPAERLLLRDGAPVPLTHRLFETLLTFARTPGRVLTKDELMEAVWPGRYMEEASLKQAIFSLRKVLSDSGDDARYIVTAPGRGYSFAAPVQKVSRTTDAARSPLFAQVPSASVAEPSRWRGSALRYAAPFMAVAVVAACIASYLWNQRVPQTASEPNVLVLADFQNLTNDPALGTVLGKVLQIDLAQSPFLSLVSPLQVNKTLQLMERPASATLTPQLAQEVCARMQATAVLSGAVASIGSGFVVTLEARDCDTGRSLAEDKAEVARKEDVPRALDGLSLQMREALNDSSASIRKFGAPIDQATTSSFEALKAYSLGERARANGDNASAIGFFKHAADLDPSFALAYAELGSSYFGLRESELGKTYFQKAFSLRNRASENEKLDITAIYYERLGNATEAVRAYQIWAQTYPRDWLPWAHLANLLAGMARYDEAIAAGREALRLNDDHYGPYSVLARAYKRATRFADAKAVGRLAVGKGLDGWDMHGLLYEIAFAEGDATAMAEQAAKEKGKATETWMLDYEGLGAATAGQSGRSRAYFEKAIGIAHDQGPDSQEESANFIEDEIETSAVLGLKGDARKIADAATVLDASEYQSFALALAGDFERAAAAATALAKRYPDSTEVNDSDVPQTRAVIYLGQGRPNDAISALQPALAYELRDFWTSSLLGQAYLDTNAPDKAAMEFRKVLANRGVDGLSPLYPLAYLGLARALHMEGKLQESRTAYESLFAFWKDADKDLPVLQDARREYARLVTPVPATKPHSGLLRRLG
jgi:DNA-binding winged helix-turn-helix (wHTH) protein/tetratricopeptide (TPR) repeat protein